jgi:hypothetical protein
MSIDLAVRGIVVRYPTVDFELELSEVEDLLNDEASRKNFYVESLVESGYDMAELTLSTDSYYGNLDLDSTISWLEDTLDTIQQKKKRIEYEIYDPTYFTFNIQFENVNYDVTAQIIQELKSKVTGAGMYIFEVDNNNDAISISINTTSTLGRELAVSNVRGLLVSYMEEIIDNME